jgi:hypothetical protein
MMTQSFTFTSFGSKSGHIPVHHIFTGKKMLSIPEPFEYDVGVSETPLREKKKKTATPSTDNPKRNKTVTPSTGCSNKGKKQKKHPGIVAVCLSPTSRSSVEEHFEPGRREPSEPVPRDPSEPVPREPSEPVPGRSHDSLESVHLLENGLLGSRENGLLGDRENGLLGICTHGLGVPEAGEGRTQTVANQRKHDSGSRLNHFQSAISPIYPIYLRILLM